YKGKRMAGRMGHVRVTVKNLKVMDVLDDKILIRGLLPGGRNSMVFIQKVGKDRKFVPLYKEAEKTEKTEEKEDKKEKKE
ncbi:hypothetical protein M1615_04450, partial [Patescibacteria group bacterium]|nr:hypothetical protein [Patescibacteria group bacterium]